MKEPQRLSAKRLVRRAHPTAGWLYPHRGEWLFAAGGSVEFANLLVEGPEVVDDADQQ